VAKKIRVPIAIGIVAERISFAELSRKRVRDRLFGRFKDSKIQRFKDSKIQRFKDSKIQKFKDSVITIHINVYLSII